MPRSAPDPTPTVARTPRPHDALFKAAFEQPEHAAALLRESFDAPIREAIDWRTLAPYPGSFIDPQLADFHSDLLFTAQLDGNPALIYVLLEHQSTQHAYMPLRMLHYMTLVWLRYCKEHDPPMPVLLSLVITHAPGGWTGARTFSELLEPDPSTIPGLAALVPSFSLTLRDLAHMSDEELKGSALAPFPTLAMWLLRDARNAVELFIHFAFWATTLTQVYRTPRGIEPILMTLAEQFREEGRQEAREEARRETLRATLRKLLALKFGPPSPEVEARIASASEEELDSYLERVVSAPDLAAVFAT